MTVEEELTLIAETYGGVLRPADVVNYARDPTTMLHQKFTWDDSEAAEQWRLVEARKVIRVHVIPHNNSPVAVRAYVSLAADRHHPGGGYRRIQDVMASEELRRQYLTQAITEAKQWHEKFQALEELDPVFVAIDEVEKQVEYLITSNTLPAKVLAVMST